MRVLVLLGTLACGLASKRWELAMKIDGNNVPVLLLWGAKDQLIHVSSVSIWEAGIPAIQTHIWPDVGHLPMMEVPAESAAVVNQFIASLKDRPASG